MLPEHEAEVVAMLEAAMTDHDHVTVDLKDYDYVPTMIQVGQRWCHLASVVRTFYGTQKLNCTYLIGGSEAGR